MPQEIPKLRVTFLNGRDVFPSILCEECGRFPTQHRCLFDVTKHGYLFDGHQVCGTAVCSICASSFGNEGIFTCAEHSSTKENERPAVKDNERPAAKDNERPAAKDNNHGSAKWTNRVKLKPDEEKKKKERGVEYSATEILLLSKAWISASENTITGVHQKMNTFWDSVLHSYNIFKQQHDDYMAREKEIDKFRMRNMMNSVSRASDFPDEDMDEAIQLPVRNVGSLQQKWSKKVQPLVFKFIGVTNRYPKKSGEDKEAYYNRVHIIFLKENSSKKSFDIYRPSWEYLQDKPKFSVACAVPSNNKNREVITIDGNEEVNEVESSVKLRPMGRNSMKRKMEEEKILASVSKRMESEGATSASSFLASALTEIAKCVGAAVSSWQMQLAIPNASPDLQRQYYDAIVKRQLEQMMTEDTSSSSTDIPHQIDLQTPSSRTSAAKAMTKLSGTSTESNDADNCDDDDFSEVPGRILPPF
jgi:hypothetical protein